MVVFQKVDFVIELKWNMMVNEFYNKVEIMIRANSSNIISEIFNFNISQLTAFRNIN